MAKQSKAAKANKSHKSRSPKVGLGTRSDKAGGHSKKGYGIKRSAANDKVFRDNEKMAKGKNSKGGCLPKVLMMLLLFTFVGTYFF